MTTQDLIGRGKVAAFFYSLKDESGQELENNRNDGPMVYMHGKRNILHALEDALVGKGAGDEVSVTLPPEKAYGPIRENATSRVSKKRLNIKPQRMLPGVVVKINTADGTRDATIVKVGKFNVDLDTNHPLAGKTVTFDITIDRVRDASAEEKQHGHAHGIDGGAHDH